MVGTEYIFMLLIKNMFFKYAENCVLSQMPLKFVDVMWKCVKRHVDVNTFADYCKHYCLLECFYFLNFISLFYYFHFIFTISIC